MLPDKKTVAKLQLPSWATLVVPRFKVTSQSRASSLSLPEEESYLRTRSYHAASRQMNKAASEALQLLAAPVHAELQDLLAKVGTSSNSSTGDSENADANANSAAANAAGAGSQDSISPSPVKRPRTSQDATEADGYRMELSTRYNPLLLPVMILEGPSYRLDRQEWMRHLVLSTKQTRPRSAVVWLRRPTASAARTAAANTAGVPHVFSRQAELMRQCLRLEDDLPPALKSKRKLAKASLTDMLLLWAGHTTAFDDIVVFWEMDESFYTRGNQDFLTWLAERRALDKLPFSVVLLGPHVGRRRLELRSASQGPVGLMVRRCVLPSTDELLAKFADNLWTKQVFSVPFSPTILSTITQSYREQNKSAVYVMLKLKEALAHSFIPRGSFRTCIAGGKDFLREERSRIAWFLLDESARALLLSGSNSSATKTTTSRSAVVDSLQELESCRRKACVALQVLGILGNQSDLPFFYCGNNEEATKASEVQKIQTRQRQQIMSLLAQLRSTGTVQPDSTSLNALVFSGRRAPVETLLYKTITTLVNELIVIIDKCTYLSEVEQCLFPIVDDWVEQTNRLQNSSGSISSALASLTMQPRRHLVAGIAEALPADKEGAVSVANVPGGMFKLVQDRVSISQDDWFGAFEETIASQASRQDSILLFTYGLNFLKVCGLIREKRVRGNTIFEKAVLVWSSGD
jgi:hypothetical protein